jgi:hypothetical protein
MRRHTTAEIKVASLQVRQHGLCMFRFALAETLEPVVDHFERLTEHATEPPRISIDERNEVLSPGTIRRGQMAFSAKHKAIAR